MINAYTSTTKWNEGPTFQKQQSTMKAILKLNKIHTVVFDTNLMPDNILDSEKEVMEIRDFIALKLTIQKDLISIIVDDIIARET